MPQTRAQIRSVYECCSPGHEIENLKDRDYFIWEVSIHFATDVINKWVKYIPLDECVCRISFSNCPILLESGGRWAWSLSSDTLTVSAVGHSALAQPEYTASVLCLLMTIFSAISFSLCLLESCAGWNFLSASVPENLNPPSPTPAGIREILPAPAPHPQISNTHQPRRPSHIALFRSQTRTCPKTTKSS